MFPFPIDEVDTPLGIKNIYIHGMINDERIYIQSKTCTPYNGHRYCVSVEYDYSLGLDKLKEDHVRISKDDSLTELKGREEMEILDVVRQIVIKWVSNDFDTKWKNSMLWQLNEKKKKWIEQKKNADMNIKTIDKMVKDIENKRSCYGNWARAKTK